MATFCENPDLCCPLCGRMIGMRVRVGAGPHKGAVGVPLEGCVSVCNGCAGPIQWLDQRWNPMKEAAVKQHDEYVPMRQFAGKLLEKIWG